MAGGQAGVPFGLFNPAAGSDPSAGIMNPNLLYAAGTQMFANQAQSVLNQYAEDISHKGRSWVGQKVSPNAASVRRVTVMMTTTGKPMLCVLIIILTLN